MIKYDLLDLHRKLSMRLTGTSTLSSLLILTLAVRVGVFLVVPGALEGDPDGYRRLAENVVEHGTFGEGTQPTAYRPPLYPLLLVPCVALGKGAAGTWAIGLLHVVLGVGTVWLVWRLGRRCGLGRWAPLAGALVACDPILLGQSTVVMTETAAAFFVVLALLALARTAEAPSCWRGAVAGAALGLCGLCRPELLLWAAACAPAMFIVRSRWGAMPTRAWACRRPPNGHSHGHASVAMAPRVAIAPVVALVLGALVVLAPWAVRNQMQFGRPIVTTTHGGYTLLLANNPSYYEWLREGEPAAAWDAQSLGPVWGGKAHHDTTTAELAADRRAYAEAWQNIRRQPAMFAYSCLVGAGRFWALAPRRGATVLRWAIGLGYLAEFALAAVGLCAAAASVFHHPATENTHTNPPTPAQNVPPCPPCLRGESSGALHGLWLWGLLLAISMTALHVVYWSDMRMRAPLEPVVALAAAAGIACLCRWARVVQAVVK